MLCQLLSEEQQPTDLDLTGGVRQGADESHLSMMWQQLSRVATLNHETSAITCEEWKDGSWTARGRFSLSKFLSCQATTDGHRITGMETQVLEHFAHSQWLRKAPRNTVLTSQRYLRTVSSAETALSPTRDPNSCTTQSAPSSASVSSP